MFLGRMFWLRDSPLRDSPFQGQRERGAKWLTVLSCSMKSIEYRITRQQNASAGFFSFSSRVLRTFHAVVDDDGTTA